MTDPAAHRVLAELGVVMLERDDAGTFRATGVTPDWFKRLFPEPGALRAHQLQERLPFLDAFLPDAEDFWASRSEGRLRSGLCAEDDGIGGEFHFEVSALSIGSRTFLLFELRKDFDETREILQRARQNLLDYELLERTQRALERSQADLRRAKDAAEAATQAKSAFLAHMSHEIRNPMNAVIGLTGILLKSSLEPRQREFLEIVRNSGEALLAILNDILDFSKIESGKLELESRPFEVHRCVEEALDLFAVRALDKQLELAAILSSEVPIAVVGDVTRLRQILVNLVGNAIKFTSAGEVAVRLTGRKLDERNWELEFAVKDTGIGIPRDRKDRLFQSFSQVDSSVARKYGGTGLGLAICKSLSELMGGRIWVESETGRGSVFAFTVRVADAGQAPPSWLSGPDRLLAGKRLWMVGSTATNREIVRELGGLWGMQVETFDGVAGVQARLAQRVACDAWISEDPGGQETEALGDRHIIMVPAGRLEEGQRAGGGAAILTKPIKPSRLHAALRAMFGAEPAQGETGARTIAEAPAEPSKLRILLADDSVINQRVGLAILESLGYRAATAGNGLEVLSRIRQEAFDVVLMDVQMPEMDGLEATRRIRTELPPDRQPRIIAMTANVQEDDRRLCVEAGMDDHISKPVRESELRTVLAHSSESGCAGTVEEHVQTSPEAKVPDGFDPAVVEMLRSMNAPGQPDLFGELLAVYRPMLSELSTKMREAVDSLDAETLRQVAHKLRGSSANIGAVKLAELCGSLEELGRSGKLAGAVPLVSELEALSARLLSS